MIQILLHFWGDYVFQTEWMALNKRKHWFPAIVHGFVYGSLFWWFSLLFPELLTCSNLAYLVIVSTHILIDHFYPARHLIFAKNWVTDFSIKWKDRKATGYGEETPIWLAFWLVIIVDNTLHITINYLALSLL